MTFLAIIFGVFPLVWLPIVLVLQLGMINIFRSGYRGMQISAAQLFEGFNNGKFMRNAGGMGWKSLWLLIWGLVPIVGIIKYYSYRFVPYIMLAEPDISATDALKKSIAQTNGFKGKMFLTDFIIGAAIFVVAFVFGLLTMIPLVGPVFGVIGVLCYIVVMIFLPLFFGILEAVYYEKISKENPLP